MFLSKTQRCNDKEILPPENISCGWAETCKTINNT